MSAQLISGDPHGLDDMKPPQFVAAGVPINASPPRETAALVVPMTPTSVAHLSPLLASMPNPCPIFDLTTDDKLRENEPSDVAMSPVCSLASCSINVLVASHPNVALVVAAVVHKTRTAACIPLACSSSLAAPTTATSSRNQSDTDADQVSQPQPNLVGEPPLWSLRQRHKEWLQRRRLRDAAAAAERCRVYIGYTRPGFN